MTPTPESRSQQVGLDWVTIVVLRLLDRASEIAAIEGVME
jgi:hypothetical protein